MKLQAPKSDGIFLDDTDLLKCPPEQRAKLGVGCVPQGRELFPQLTVEENLRVGLGIRKNAPRSIPSRIFELFPVLKQMMKRRGGDLSGGQQQQLAIGRALVLEPKRPVTPPRSDRPTPPKTECFIIGIHKLAGHWHPATSLLFMEQGWHRKLLSPSLFHSSHPSTEPL